MQTRLQISLVVTKRYDTKVYGSHHGDNPLLKPTGIQIATKSLPGLTTGGHRKLIRVKTMPWYELEVLSEVLAVFPNLKYKQPDMISCPSTKVIKYDKKNVLLAIRGLALHETNLCDTFFTRIVPINVKTVQQNSLLHIERNLDRLGLFSSSRDKPVRHFIYKDCAY